jgi:predicted Zn-dependent peptidase
MSATSLKPDLPQVEIRTLANGVRIVCDPMPGLETLALSVVAGRGARAEDPRRSGWSHLLEHMVFKGAGSRSARDIVEAIEAEGGSINAATGYERTSFQVRALRGGLKLGLDVIADLMLKPGLDPTDLSREKQVIAQEIAEAADAPDDLVFELAQTAAFDGQPLGRPILGTVESIGEADPAELEAWRAALYAPDRLVIGAAGAVDADELAAFAEAAFGGAAGQGAPPSETAGFVGGTRPLARLLEQANMAMLLPAPGACDPAYFALRLLAEILGGGMASRLFQEARERRGLAYAIDAYTETYEDVGVLGIFAGCNASDAAELAQVAAGELEGMTRGPSDEELSRAKAQLKASLFMSRESAASRAEAAAAQVLMFGRILPPAELAQEIDAVEAGDIARLAQTILGQRRSAVAVLGPRAALPAAKAFQRAVGGSA